MTIADYAEQIANGQITINHEYQRTDRVWPISAKSNLIDTILAGYPIPKLILSQTTDLDTKKTRKEVVDGQQRTTAILEFLRNKFTLSRGEFAGSKFETLDDAKKREFLDFPLSADVFSSATKEDIREVFRRINSYMVPLNKPETRHATHQGEFKWFIRDLGKQYATSFTKMGVMAERQISRMADLELLTELVHLLKAGIKTASPVALNKLYDEYDAAFPERNEIEDQVNFGLNQIIDLPEIHETKLTTKSNLYSLFAAFVVVRFDNLVLRQDLDEVDQNKVLVERPAMISNLTMLADAIDQPEGGNVAFEAFIHASMAGTNTRVNRLTRFKWLHRAITSEAL